MQVTKFLNQETSTNYMSKILHPDILDALKSSILTSEHVDITATLNCYYKIKIGYAGYLNENMTTTSSVQRKIYNSPYDALVVLNNSWTKVLNQIHSEAAVNDHKDPITIALIDMDSHTSLMKIYLNVVTD